MTEARRRGRSWFVFVLEALLVIGIVFSIHAWKTRHLVPAGEAAPAPGVALPDLRGGTTSLESFRGSPTLVYFFAPWCGACAASADNLERLSRWRSGSLDVVLVALDYETASEVEAYVQKHELSMPVLLGDRQTAERWRIGGYPTYYVLDAAGNIRHRDYGYSTMPGLMWRTWGVD